MLLLERLFVVAHVAAGVGAVASGAAAMLAAKGGSAHRRLGRTYLATLAGACASGTALAIQRWPRFPHLLALAGIAAALAALGFAARGRPSRVLHLLGMSASYVAMLTAFYVDNGPKLPLWRQLPPSVFWVLPSLVALPLIVRATRRERRRSPDARPAPRAR
ncbi:MAG TPA: DUF2306 domain-containing protein [Myxococcota bacterium]|nr:DUF2306 domain-containing protein [Myxococcota bacterium]